MKREKTEEEARRRRKKEEDWRERGNFAPKI
jgi:hypothetical protein